MIDQLFASQDPADQARAGDLSPRLRVFYNVIVPGEESRGPQVLATGVQIFEQLLGYFTDPGWGDFTHPKTGYNVTINRTGIGLNTEYKVRPDRAATPLSDMEVLEHLHDLTKSAQVRTYEQVKNLFHGGAPFSQAPDSSTVSTPSSVVPQSVTDAKPRCFGEFSEGDQICSVCRFHEDCSRQKEGEVTEEAKPKCFGNAQFFDVSSASCKQCKVYELCAVEIKSKLR